MNYTFLYILFALFNFPKQDVIVKIDTPKNVYAELVSENSDRWTGQAPEKVVYEIPIEIKNNSSETFKYWNMSCAWQDIYIIDDPNLRFDSQPCEHNSGTIFSIGPKQTQTEKIYLIPKTSDYKLKDLRIGIILVDEKVDKLEFYRLIRKKESDNGEYLSMQTLSYVNWSNIVNGSR